MEKSVISTKYKLQLQWTLIETTYVVAHPIAKKKNQNLLMITKKCMESVDHNLFSFNTKNLSKISFSQQTVAELKKQEYLWRDICRIILLGQMLGCVSR